MKEMKRPFTLYYESRYLRAVALLDQVESYMENISRQLDCESCVLEEGSEELVRINGLLTRLLATSSRKRNFYKSELEELIRQNKREKDFLDGKWEPEYY